MAAHDSMLAVVNNNCMKTKMTLFYLSILLVQYGTVWLLLQATIQMTFHYFIVLTIVWILSWVYSTEHELTMFITLSYFQKLDLTGGTNLRGTRLVIQQWKQLKSNSKLRKISGKKSQLFFDFIKLTKGTKIYTCTHNIKFKFEWHELLEH